MSEHSIRSLGILALTIGFLVGCGERQKRAESDGDTASAVEPVVVTQSSPSMDSADKTGSGKEAAPHPTSPSKDLFLSFCGYLNGSQDSTAQIDLATVTEENTAEMMKIKDAPQQYRDLLKSQPGFSPDMLVGVNQKLFRTTTEDGNKRTFRLKEDIIVEERTDAASKIEELGRWQITRSGEETTFKNLNDQSALASGGDAKTMTGPWRIKGCLFSNASISQSSDGNVTFSMGGGGALPRNLGVLIEFAQPPSREYLANFVITMDGTSTGELAWAQKTDDGQIVYFSRDGGWPLGKEFTLSGNGHKQASKTPPVAR